MNIPRLRIRATLAGSDPEIWRLLEVDGDLDLERVHNVLQRAFGWRTEHLHMFCRVDPNVRHEPGVLDERWYDQGSLDEGLEGSLESDATLADVLTEASPELFYEYDFGDGWTHRLELVGVTDAETPAPAHVIDGARHCPIEDSGGIHGYLDKLKILADPNRPDPRDIRGWVNEIVGPWEVFDAETFDIGHTNSELALLGGQPPLAEAWQQLTSRMPDAMAGEFRRYARPIAHGGPSTVDADVAAEMVKPYTWLLRRVGAEGLKLSAAGWMPPDVVAEAMRELEWQSPYSQIREDRVRPVAWLRADAVRFGLLRKSKGRLLVTSSGAKLMNDPPGLWRHLARAFTTRAGGDVEQDAAILFAVEVVHGSVDDSTRYLSTISWGLEMLGWQAHDGGHISDQDVSYLVRDARHVLNQLSVFGRTDQRFEAGDITPGGLAFARAVLTS